MKLVDISLSVLVLVLILCPIAQICALVWKLVAPWDLSWTCALAPTFVFMAAVAIGGAVVGVCGVLRKDGV